MPEPKRSLHTKLAQVMYEAERIPKNGVAPAAMGGFRFVQVGDAADVIRKALAEQQISMIPTAIEVVGETEHTTSSQKIMTTLTVRTTWTLTDGESGESINIQSLGSGADTGDKAAPKAQSNAMKYALLMGFLLSTGDDPEQTDTSDRQGQGDARPEPPRLPPRVDPAAADPAPKGGPEVEELIGRESRRGIIRKGTSDRFKLDPHQGPAGHVIGFKLETGKGNIPQCIVSGPIGEALFLATAGHPETLAGTSATVAGILYYVKNDKGSWYRLHVDRFENADYVIPAEEALALPEPPEDLHLVGETA